MQITSSNLKTNNKNKQVQFRGEKQFHVLQKIVNPKKVKSFLQGQDINQKCAVTFFDNIFEEALAKFKNNKRFDNFIFKEDDVDFRAFSFEDSKGNTLVVNQGYMYPSISLTEIPNVKSASKEKPLRSLNFRFSLPNEPVLITKTDEKFHPAPLYTKLKNKVLKSEIQVMSKDDNKFRNPIKVDSGKCWYTFA